MAADVRIVVAATVVSFLESVSTFAVETVAVAWIGAVVPGITVSSSWRSKSELAARYVPWQVTCAFAAFGVNPLHVPVPHSTVPAVRYVFGGSGSVSCQSVAGSGPWFWTL